MAEKKTILVVDDFTSIRKFVCETLERKGYRTLGVGSGDEAYEILKKNEKGVDLVLTDYHMPDCTGYDLLVMIKANSETAKIPVVFLTTELSPEKMKQSKDAGLAAWIKKPYRSEAFFATIHQALKHEN
jgi:two-component system, chemotaxis family, chemotaxis protein CheY